MNGVLDHARTIAEREEMHDPQLRYDVSLAPRDVRTSRKRYSRSDIFECSLEDRKIALGCLYPSHRSARRVRAFAHGVTADVVCQQAGDLGAQGFGIPKMNENTAPVTQQFLGVEIGAKGGAVSPRRSGA